MLRYLNVLLAVVALGLAVACGRQVTPEPSTANLTGQMALKLTVSGPVSSSLSQFGYEAVINTSGYTGGSSSGTPNIQDFNQGNFQAFSAAFIVGAQSLHGFGSCGGGGLPLSSPSLIQYYIIGQGQPGCIFRSLPPNIVWIPNFGNQPNEFEIIFPRSILALPPVTGSPTPSSAPSTTPTPSSSPTSSGASPSPTPVSSPTTSAQATWYINFFVINQQGQAIDQMGGITSTGFKAFSIDTQSSVTNIQQNTEISPPSLPGGAIISAEVDNFP